MSLRTGLSGLLLILFTLPGIAAPRILHFSYEGGEDSPRGRSANLFAQLVNDRFPGELQVITHANGTLFDDATAVRELRFDTGAMDPPERPGGRTPNRLYNGLMTAVDLGMAARWARPLTVFELPYLMRSTDAAHRLIDSPLFAELTEPLPRSGFMPLGIWDGGMLNVAVQEIQSIGPDTLRGRRLNISDSNVSRLFAETLGATVGGRHDNAWVGTWWQLAQRLETGSDASVIATAHAYQGFIVLIGMDFWAALPERLQTGLRTAVMAATTANRRYATAAEARAREELSTRLGKDHIIQPEGTRLWEDATAPIRQHLRRRVGDALFDRITREFNSMAPPGTDATDDRPHN
ncbi:MAG: hypothetical protein H6981_11505 [Gammaproteobacteria bacterium]|nr:hypothetical protein [Gammaproteobacteria bacterium]MCP5137413.1 hypothetical protein [Gammaproteobacteria bacterium]